MGVSLGTLLHQRERHLVEAKRSNWAEAPGAPANPTMAYMELDEVGWLEGRWREVETENELCDEGRAEDPAMKQQKG